MPKVSVILPVYNSEKYLAEAVRSILNQDFTDFELIIIDDGSTDSTPKVYAGFSDARIKIIKKERIGITKALNCGLSVASGEYVARMDSDDLSAPARLSRQVSVLDNSVKVGAVGCWAQVIDMRGRVIANHTPKTTHNEIKKAFLFSAPILHPSAMFRMTALKELGGYDESFLYAQDRDLFLRLCANWELLIIPEFLFLSRVNPDSITITKERLQKKFSILALERAILSGLFPWYWFSLVLFKKFLLLLPGPVLRVKNILMIRLGFRHE